MRFELLSRLGAWNASTMLMLALTWLAHSRKPFQSDYDFFNDHCTAAILDYPSNAIFRLYKKSKE